MIDFDQLCVKIFTVNECCITININNFYVFSKKNQTNLLLQSAFFFRPLTDRFRALFTLKNLGGHEAIDAIGECKYF